MKTPLVVALLAILTIVAVPAASIAEEGGWKLPGLAPFKRKQKPQINARARVSDAPTSGWKWPKLWPSREPTPAQSNPANQTTWQKMNSGTKNFLSQTADTLNPFNDANDNPPEQKVTGSSSMFSQASRNSEAKSKSFLPSWPWGGAEEEEQRPKTVNDFLMQPRPDY